MSKIYNPTSYFFVDQTQLTTVVNPDNSIDQANLNNLATDAFGPVSSNPTAQFRTTSKVHSSNKTKVFAICDGRILIQPNAGNSSKVNLILKPNNPFSSLKIKYFVYRGVDMGDLIGNLLLQPKNTNDPDQPIFLQRIWDEYISFALSVNNPDGVNTPPDLFPSFLIGYDPDNQPQASLIDDYFYNSINPISSLGFELPECHIGDHIGNFTGTIGLDVVLDYGDSHLENQEELFKLDLAFARADEFKFDLTSLTDVTNNGVTISSAIRQQRLKEYSRQFLDAAAFWGSHVDCGTIKLYNNATSVNDYDNVFKLVLNKFLTANKVYVYITEKRGRSYNFYSENSSKTVSGFTATPGKCLTSGWPLIIADTPVSTVTPNSKYAAQISLQFNIDFKTPVDNRRVYFDVIAPSNDVKNYLLAQKPIAGTSGDTLPLSIKLQTHGTKFSSTFLIINSYLTQDPDINYYEDLWPANFTSNLKLPPAPADLSYWSTYDKNVLLNLSPKLNIGASMQTKVVIDTGSSGTTTKKRRLFISAIKGNSYHTSEFDKLNSDNLAAGISNSTSSMEDYSLILYKDKNLSVFKCQLTDDTGSGPSFTFNALCLIHLTDFEVKKRFFNLGITDEQYNSLFTGLPPFIDNVFFSLQEVLDSSNISVCVNKDYRKYNLGLRYEINDGTVVTNINSLNPIQIYTLDGYYFFSKDFSDYQNFYNEFAKASVEFRPLVADSHTTPPTVAYNGEFGFDWIRVGDNGELLYKDLIKGGYEAPTTIDSNSEFETPGEAFKALKERYEVIPTKILDSPYYVPYLKLFSESYVSGSSIINSSPASPTFADLRVFVRIDEAVGKLEFDYDKTLFNIDKDILSDTQVRPKSIGADKKIRIRCLKDFNENQQIRILAYPPGVTDKQYAKIAGMINVEKNSALYTKELKFVFVLVSTNRTLRPSGRTTGFVQNEEIAMFKNALSQCLINPDFETKFMSVESVHDFNRGGAYFDGIYIKAYASDIYTVLQQKFTNLYPQYQNSYMVFVFNEEAKESNGALLAGKAQPPIGTHSAIIYKGRKIFTLAHEVLHGLGLYHSHRDGEIQSPDQAFVFPAYNDNGSAGLDPTNDANEVTDNYMSYNPSSRTSTWHWQFKTVQSNVSKT